MSCNLKFVAHRLTGETTFEIWQKVVTIECVLRVRHTFKTEEQKLHFRHILLFVKRPKSGGR